MRISPTTIGRAVICASLFATSSVFAEPVNPPLDPASTALGVSIKVLSTSKAAARTVPRIVDEANRIWTRYGVRLVREEDTSHRRLQIVIVDSPLPGTFAEGEGERGLGWITFLSPDNPRNVIYLSWARTAALFSEIMNGRPIEQWPDRMIDTYLGRALGRTLAHEVGHYVLASSEHTRTGLMRTSYPAAELFSADVGGFRLDAKQVLGCSGARVLGFLFTGSQFRSSGFWFSAGSSEPWKQRTREQEPEEPENLRT